MSNEEHVPLFLLQFPMHPRMVSGVDFERDPTHTGVGREKKKDLSRWEGEKERLIEVDG